MRYVYLLILALFAFSSPCYAVQLLFSGSGAQVVSNSATNYLFISAQNGIAPQASEANARQVIPTDGDLGGLYAYTDDAPSSASDSHVITLVVNGSDTGVSCTIDDSGFCFIESYVAITAPSTVSTKVAPVGSPNIKSIYTQYVFKPRNRNESIVLGSTGAALLTGTNNYQYAYGNFGSALTGEFVKMFIPKAGTLKKLCGEISAAPGGASTRTLTMDVNGSDTSLSIVFTSSSGTLICDNTNTASVADGDYIRLHHIRSGLLFSNWKWGFVYENNGGDYLMSMTTTDSLDSGTSEYVYLGGVQSTMASGSADVIEYAATRTVFKKWRVDGWTDGAAECPMELVTPTYTITTEMNSFLYTYVESFYCNDQTFEVDDLDYLTGYDDTLGLALGYMGQVVQGFGYSGTYYIRQTFLANTKRRVALT